MIRAKFGVCGLCSYAKFHPDWFTALPLRGENSQISPHFQLQHSVVAPSCGAETKLNVGGCTTTNLPLSHGIKVVSILKHLNGEVFSTNSTIQKCDGQMKKTNKKRLLLAAHEVGAAPYSAQRSVPFLQFVSDIATFVLKRDVKLQLTN